MNLYFRNTGSTVWALATNWSQSNGGPGDGSIPTTADAVFFTSNSGNVVISATIPCLSLNCTGYNGTFTGTGTLTVSGDFILSSTMINSWTGVLQVVASAIITTNGKNLNGGLTLTGLTYTITNDFSIVGTLSLATATPKVINGGTITLTSSGTFSVGVATSGTATFRLSQTGSWTGSSAMGNNVIIDTTGTITLPTTSRCDGNFTYVKGTVVTTGNTMTFGGANQTITTGSIVFNNIQLNGTILTLSNNITITGNFNCTTTGGAKTINGFTIYIGGSLTVSIATSGTTNIVLNGTGNWSGNSTAPISNNLTIDTLGTITLTTNVAIASTIFTYVKGTIVANNGLYCPGNVIFVGAWQSTTWNVLSFSAATATYVLNSDLSCNTFQISATGTKTCTGYKILCNSLSATSGTMVGTTELIIGGTGGTWTTSTGAIAVPITVNCSGIITLSGAGVRIGSVTAFPNNTVLRWISGTINQAGFVFAAYGDVTIDTNAVQFDTFQLGGSNVPAINVTLQSTLRANTISCLTGLVCTLLGSAGFITGTFVTQWQTTAASLSLTPGILYRVTSSINISLNSTNDGVIYGHIIKSTINGTKATLTLDIGGTCVIGYITFQDIDASGGRGIGVWQGVINNCNNVYALSDPVVTLSKSFVA